MKTANKISLIALLAWIRSHSVKARIVGDAVRLTLEFAHSSHVERVDVRTLAEARKALNY